MTERDSLQVRLAIHIYRAAIQALPSDHRRAVGHEMVHAFTLACRSATAGLGTLGLMRATGLAVLDVIRCLPREWKGRARRDRERRVVPRNPMLLSDETGGNRKMSGVVQEVSFALRFLRRRPGYSAIVVLTLALGIGANTTVFSLVHGVLFRRSTLPEADRVISFGEVNPNIDIPPRWASVPNYLDWREQTRSFESLAMFRGRSMSVTGGDRPLYAYGSFVTNDFFRVMGVTPLLGRVIDRAESENNAGVVVIGYGLWQTVTGSDSSIVGKTMAIDGVQRTVIGVMPAGFDAPGPWIAPGSLVALWIPFTSMDDSRVNRSYHVAGRLASGVLFEDAHAEMALLSRRLSDEYPAANADWRIVLTPWQDLVVGNARSMLLLAWASAGFVLLICCVNVAGLVLNCTIARRGELAVRRALGARRGRVTLQLLIESLMLSASGGVVGVMLAAGALEIITALNPGTIPLMDRVGLHPVVLGVTFASVVLVAVAVSLLSVLRVTGAALLSGLTMSERRHTASGRWLKEGMATLQLAITFVLLVGAGLLTRSLFALRSVDTGLETRDVFQVTVALSWNRVTTSSERTRFVEGVLERLRALPGVRSAGMVNSLPFSGSNAWQPVWLGGEPIGPSEEQPVVSQRNVSPGYFETVGIPVLQGRDFVDADVRTATSAIVNRTMAERFWGAGPAIGRRVAVNDAADTLTIVGVVGDVRHFGPRDEAPSELYQVYSRDFLTSKSFVIRMVESLDADLTRRQFQDVIFAQDPEQPVRDAGPLTEVVGRAVGAERFTTSMLGIASAIAVLLASVGVFGVMANVVLERRKELALRQALGSTRRKTAALVLVSGLKLGIAGSAIGCGTSIYASGYLRPFLFGVPPRDVLTLMLVSGGVLALCVLAGLVPAARASRVPLAEVLSAD